MVGVWKRMRVSEDQVWSHGSECQESCFYSHSSMTIKAKALACNFVKNLNNERHGGFKHYLANQYANGAINIYLNIWQIHWLLIQLLNIYCNQGGWKQMKSKITMNLMATSYTTNATNSGTLMPSGWRRHQSRQMMTKKELNWWQLPPAPVWLPLGVEACSAMIVEDNHYN